MGLTGLAGTRQGALPETSEVSFLAGSCQLKAKKAAL